MDGAQFDRLVKAAFRRSVLRRDAIKGLLGGGLAAGLGSVGSGGTLAKAKTCKAGKDVCDATSNKKFKKAKCGAKGSGCFCATGTSATICAKFGDTCTPTADDCQTDDDCTALTGPGSVCTLFTVGGSCVCGEDVQGFKSCMSPCTAAAAATQSSRSGATSRVRMSRDRR
jgi:hypothetical protein